MSLRTIVQHITVQISQQVEIVVFRANFIHQDFKSTKNVLGGTWRSVPRQEPITPHHVLTIKGLQMRSSNFDNKAFELVITKVMLYDLLYRIW